MSTILRFLEFLSLGTWVGRLHLLGFVAGVIYLASRVALARSFGALGGAAALLVIAMLVPMLVLHYGVSPRIANLRAQMGSVDATPQDSPLRIEFNRLHRVSVQLEVAVLLAGLTAVFLTVRERPL